MSCKYDLEFKQKMVKLHEDEGVSFSKLVKTYGVSESSLCTWLQLYRKGELVPKTDSKAIEVDSKAAKATGVAKKVAKNSKKKSKHGKQYGSEVKKQIVRLYLEGESIVSLMSKFDVSAASIYTWVSQYKDEILAAIQQETEAKEKTVLKDPVAEKTQLMYYVQKENAELKNTVEKLKKENFYLRKFAAIFAKTEI